MFMLLTTTASFAVLPFIPLVLSNPMATSMITHGAIIAGVIIYELLGGTSPTANSDNTYRMPAKGEWIDLTMIPPSVKSQDLTAKKTVSQIKFDALNKKNPDGTDKYPNLKNALNKQTADGAARVDDPTNGYSVGALLQTNSIPPQFYQVTGNPQAVGQYGSVVISGGNTVSSSATLAYSQSSGGAVIGVWPSPTGAPCLWFQRSDSHIMYQAVIAVTPPVINVPRTDKEFIELTFANGEPIPPSPYSVSVTPTYATEIKDALRDNPTLTTPSGAPYVAPANAATPAQVSNYNSGGTANQSGSAAVTAANAAAAAAAAAQAAGTGTAAQTAAAQSAAAAQQALYDAAQAAGASSTAAAEAAAAQVAADTAAPVPGSPAKKTLDMVPLHALKDALNNTYPFNLPSVLSSYYTSFVAPAVAPVFTLKLAGHDMTVDLSPFEPIAILCRYLVGIVTSCGILFYIIHFFRGIS